MVFNAASLNLRLKSHEETLTAYHAILEARGKITPEDEELLMNR